MKIKVIKCYLNDTVLNTINKGDAIRDFINIDVNENILRKINSV